MDFQYQRKFFQIYLLMEKVEYFLSDPSQSLYMSTKIFFLKVPGEVFYLDGCYITQENFEQEIGTTGKLNYSDGCYITQENFEQEIGTTGY